MKTLALLVVVVLIVSTLHQSEAKSASSKSSKSKGSSSKGSYGSSSKSSSSSNIGYNNPKPASSSNIGYSNPKPKSSMTKKVVKTATKVAGAVIAYKVMKKGLKYSSFGRRGGFFPKPYRRRSMFLPIFVPVGRYRSRQYYDRDYGERLRCYLCEGRDNDLCVKNPAAGAGRDFCPPNHYCSVIRREYPTLGNGSDFELVAVSGDMTPEQCNSYASKPVPAGVDADYWDNFMGGNTGCKFRHNLSDAVLIERTCQSVYTLDEGLIDTETPTASGLTQSLAKVYTTYCTSELCNGGDGRLRCYACEGSGIDHPCMVDPANMSNIVTCGPKEFCHILRTVTMLNSTEESEDPVTIEMNITRGCRPYSKTDDDFEVVNGEDILSGVATLACASDLCNSIDGHLLSASIQEISCASGTYISFTILAITSLLLFYLT